MTTIATSFARWLDDEGSDDAGDDAGGGAAWFEGADEAQRVEVLRAAAADEALDGPAQCAVRALVAATAAGEATEADDDGADAHLTLRTRAARVPDAAER